MHLFGRPQSSISGKALGITPRAAGGTSFRP
jgi:hypothetical protein